MNYTVKMPLEQVRGLIRLALAKSQGVPTSLYYF
jgi:hypothetical protein